MSRQVLFVLTIALFFLAASFPQQLFAEETADTPVHDAGAVEERVREVFAHAPVMAEIARCESKFRQYTDSGNVLRGGTGGGMVGVFQFHERIHAQEALSHGFDITTLEGNLGYAKYVYEKQGTDPWMSSFGCWHGAQKEESSDNAELTANLSFGQSHPQVLLLQKLLNKAGFTVAESGPGSPGNETEMFGNLTRAAVRKFQCETSVTCSGDEYSTGYGFVNAQTREALLSYKGDGPKVIKKETTVKKTKSSSSRRASTKQNDIEKQRAELQARLDELLKLLAELQRQRSV